jgi:hypothetical protein
LTRRGMDIPVGSVWRLVNYPEFRVFIVSIDNGWVHLKCDGEDDRFSASDIRILITHDSLRREI